MLHIQSKQSSFTDLLFHYKPCSLANGDCDINLCSILQYDGADCGVEDSYDETEEANSSDDEFVPQLKCTICGEFDIEFEFEFDIEFGCFR